MPISERDTLSSCSLVTFVSFVVMVVPQGTLSRLAAIHLVKNPSQGSKCM